VSSFCFYSSFLSLISAPLCSLHFYCCIYVCYVRIKTSYLLTYLLSLKSPFQWALCVFIIHDPLQLMSVLHTQSVCTLTLTYHTLQSGSPTWFASLINFNDPSRPLHSSSLNLLHIPLPPRPLIAKFSGSHLQRFGIVLHKTSGYWSRSFLVPLVLLNTVSKLTSFPFPASHVPHLSTPAPLTQACLNLCAL